jgi:hypothetical protein
LASGVFLSVTASSPSVSRTLLADP